MDIQIQLIEFNSSRMWGEQDVPCGYGLQAEAEAAAQRWVQSYVPHLCTFGGQVDVKSSEEVFDNLKHRVREALTQGQAYTVKAELARVTIDWATGPKTYYLYATARG